MKYVKAQMVLLTVIVLVLSHNALAEVPSPPEQPLVGPGSNSYEHENVTLNGPYWAEGHSGNNNYRYFVFEPADPTPEIAPVILFLHGWAAISPDGYRVWIEHIVRNGYMVVWVQYQDSFLTPSWLFARNAIITWKDALKRLETEMFHVRPEKDSEGNYETAIVGHSAGGYLGAIIAAKAVKRWKEIPVPHALVAVEPGGSGVIPKARFEKIDPDTKVIIIVGDEDDIVCKSTAVSIWNEISQIPDENKEFLLVQSDYHGSPEQIANHYFPNTSGYKDTAAVDARDFYVTYKLSVGALECVFRDTDCEYALGNGSFEQVDMGQWSDGQPVNSLVWVEDPNVLETVCDDPGFRVLKKKKR